MKGQRIGYVRVSTVEQHPERQLDAIHLDRVFTDKVSGKTVHRPQLQALLEFVREGDIVVVDSMDRLARNLDDLRSIVRRLTERGIQVGFIKEQLTFSGEDSPMATLLLSVMGAFAEFERALIRERQREGIELAKQHGAYRGRKKSLTDKQVIELRTGARLGERKSELARVFGVSRGTVNEYLKE
ncbi:recombinase family protein [Alicyclobacillus sp. SO9]|uniref:recombinase family protein n=1 Tax=Alicyclobacillus sp. SO9 TaxID=2665646 RepID=UPI0018E735EB|nr:recombinase family protein [Alicyclobacillus sp. SO9]QQE79660.1 recombinase family protein [Alicyclobacillus sp. SO9]